MSKYKASRRWGYVIERNRKTGKPIKIELSYNEMILLARENIQRLKEYKNGTHE